MLSADSFVDSTPAIRLSLPTTKPVDNHFTQPTAILYLDWHVVVDALEDNSDRHIHHSGPVIICTMGKPCSVYKKRRRLRQTVAFILFMYGTPPDYGQ